MSSSTRSRTIRNITSARVSVPSLLYEDPNASDISRPWEWRTNLVTTKPFWEGWFIGLSKKFLAARGGKLLLLAGTDRLDKELTIGQMQGMSRNAWAQKLLPHLLSPWDFGGRTKGFLKLNTYLPMIIGKYQLQVFPEAGHFIHEDQPAKTAQILVDFSKRNDRSALVLPPKVGDMLTSAAMAKGVWNKT